MSTSTRPRRVLGGLAFFFLLTVALTGCGSQSVVEPPAAEGWSVTAWGERFEVFPEVEPLVAGATCVAHTHVTRLEDFSPLVDGAVEIVLSGDAGEQVFSAQQPVRPGIFAVEIRPEALGDYELVFRIRDGEGREELRGGRVRVGTSAAAGGLLVAPAPKGARDGGEPLPFLKEEQWRSDFSTAWVQTGRLSPAVAGLGRLRPPAGGEVPLTAPVDGVVLPAPGPRGGSPGWPFVGLAVERGKALFELVPGVASERSLPALEAERATLASERQVARARLRRLEELLSLAAASEREVEEARSRLEMLEARLAAAEQDLAVARAAREGRGASGLVLRAPFVGEVAEVAASPGARVAAGEALARLVRTDVVWLDVSLSLAGARRVAAEGVRSLVLTDPELEPVHLSEGLRLVSVAPELSPATGTVSVLLEAPAVPGLVLGAVLHAQILLAQEREGIVVPATAVVDDGGVEVAYLQLSGERFVRQEVHVLERRGELMLVDGLTPGQRLVTRGAASIRRSSLLGSGEVHGHVH